MAEQDEPKKKRRVSFSKIRGWAAFAFFAMVALSLAIMTGTGTFSAFGFNQIAAICPVGMLETAVTGQLATWHPLVGFTLVVVLVLIFGKAFCAWLCPTPWLQKFFSHKKQASKDKGELKDNELSVPDKVSKPDGSVVIDALSAQSDDQMAIATVSGSCGSSECAGCSSSCALSQVGGKRDGMRLDSRHAILGGAVVTSALFGFPVFCLICPVGLTIATFIGLWHLLQFNETTWGLLLFPVIVILEVVVFRKWCHTFCPISALLSLISSGNKTLKPKVDNSRCLRKKGIDCHTCVEICPEQVDPHTGFIPECSKCGQCVDSCPVQAIHIR